MDCNVPYSQKPSSILLSKAIYKVLLFYLRLTISLYKLFLKKFFIPTTSKMRDYENLPQTNNFVDQHSVFSNA